MVTESPDSFPEETVMFNHYLTDLVAILGELHNGEFQSVVNQLEHAIKDNKTIFICGNGGSAEMSCHFAADLQSMIGRPVRAISLAADMAVVTSYANDEGFQKVFTAQLDNLAQPGDILIAISTSGQSPNMIDVAIGAKARGLRTICLTGKSGNLSHVIDYPLRVCSDGTQHIQDVHMILIHMICTKLAEIFNDADI